MNVAKACTASAVRAIVARQLRRETPMAKVLGIGGIFFKTADPDALKAWYARVLGFPVSKWGGAKFAHPTQGVTVWTPFKADTDHFAPSPHPFMVNLIVDDIDGVLAHAKTEGVEPLDRQDDENFGRFAWLLDPAGIKVELWQPVEAKAG
jgi:catechol 2,3-dioxygenase-like lactoylglutathione lyase family enzyme